VDVMRGRGTGCALVWPLIMRGAEAMEVPFREAHLVGEEFANRAAGGPQYVRRSSYYLVDKASTDEGSSLGKN